MDRRCSSCKTHKGKRYCLRNNKHLCWVCCNDTRVDYKCPKECEYKAANPKKINQINIKSDSLSEFNDFLDKFILKLLAKENPLFDNQIPLQIKDTLKGKELLTEKLSSLKMNKMMATIYEKHLNINLNSKKIQASKSFEDVGKDFLQNIGELKWQNLSKYFVKKTESTIEKYIERLQKRKELISLEYFMFLASGTSKNGSEAFSSAEINYKYDISIIFKHINDEWLIDDLIFGEINLIYSETDTIKHIAYALSKAEYDRALQLLTQAEEIYYLSPDIQYYWGLYHSLTGDVDKALNCFNEASVLDSTLVEAFYNQAFIYHSANMLDKAKEFYQKTLDIDEKYINALNNLGTICLHEQNKKEARRYFQMCLGINPNFNFAVENLKKTEE